MANDNSRFLKDTQDLIRLYNQDINFQRRVDELINTPGATYRNRPLRLYVITLARFSPRYKEYERAVRKDPNKISELLVNFYRQGDYFRFGKLAPLTKVFNPEEQKTLSEAENTPYGQEQFKKFNSFLAQKDKEEEKQTTANRLQQTDYASTGSTTFATSPLSASSLQTTIIEPEEEKPVEIEELNSPVSPTIPNTPLPPTPFLPSVPSIISTPPISQLQTTDYSLPTIPPTPPIPPTPQLQTTGYNLPTIPPTPSIPPPPPPPPTLPTTDYRSSIPRSLRFEELPTSPPTEPEEEKPVEIEEPLPQVQDNITPIITSIPPTATPTPTTNNSQPTFTPITSTPQLQTTVYSSKQQKDYGLQQVAEKLQQDSKAVVRRPLAVSTLHLPIPSFVKDLGSKVKILVIKHPEAVANIASTTIGALTGFGVLRTPLGLALGAAGGGAIPFAVKKGLLSGSTRGLALKGILTAAGPIGWVAAAGSIVVNKKILKWIIIGIVAFIVGIPFFFKINEQNALLGVPGVTDATNSPGQPSPGTGTSGDIASCTFTRGGASSTIPSSILLNLLTSSAIAQNIPPAILVSIAKHESPNYLSRLDSDPEIQSGRICNPGEIFCVDTRINDRVSNALCGDDTSRTPPAPYVWAQAKGLMQALDIYNPGVDLCDLKQNITAGAQTLKGKIGEGSFTNETDVKKAVCGYFNMAGKTSCSYDGVHDYAAEVWADYQKCQTTTPTIPLPVNGDYQAALLRDFGIKFEGTPLSILAYQWAYEILYQSLSSAPKFVPTLKSLSKGQITVRLVSKYSEQLSNQLIEFNKDNTSNETYFKLVFIHELSHIFRNGGYLNEITAAINSDGDYLTGYAQGSTAANTVCAGVDSHEPTIQATEDFSETIAYYINKKTSEQNYDRANRCPPKNPSQNPYDIMINGKRKYQNHYDFISNLLGKPIIITPSPTPKVIVIDPGHGNPDPDLTEAKSEEGALNLAVALKIKSLLESNNLRAVLTHNGNIPITNHYQALKRRNEIINNTNGAFFVSVHFDSNNYSVDPWKYKPGPRAYYSDQRTEPGLVDKSKKLAEVLSSAISSRTGESIRNSAGTIDIDLDTYRDGKPFYITGPEGVNTSDDPNSKINPATKIPGTFVEYYLIQDPYNTTVYTKLSNNSSFVDKIAYGYCDGILRYVTNDSSKSCK